MTDVAAGGTTIQSSASGATATVDPASPSHGMPAAGTSTPADWTASLPDAQKAYVSSKGFKDPAMVLESYKNLETLMGAPKDRLLKLPEKFDAPEMGEVYDRLGRPKTSDEYTFAAPEGMQVNQEFSKFAKELFHKAGLSKSQGELVANEFNKYANGDAAKNQQAQAQQLATEKTALQREWGAAFEDQTKACGKAAQTFGLGKEELAKLESALGYSATMKFLAQVGSKLGEDSFVTGGESGFKGALTPDVARGQIAELKADQGWVSKYLTGDKEARNQMERLMRFAYPEPVDGVQF